MKKIKLSEGNLITLICFFLLFMFSFNGSAQTLKDFNTAFTHTVTYDEDFCRILNLTIKNVSMKEVTTIEVTVSFDADPYDWTTGPEQYIVRVSIPSMGSETVHIKVPEKNMKKPKNFWISRVRFSDGTICNK